MEFKFLEMVSSNTYIVISETYNFQIKSMEFGLLEMVSSNTCIVISETYNS